MEFGFGRSLPEIRNGGAFTGKGEFGVTTVDASASTGTQDITISGFGTPVGAVFIWSVVDTLGTRVDELRGSIGATDGTNQWASAFQSANGSGNVQCHRQSTQSHVVRSINSVGSAGGAAFDSFITDGVRVTWSGSEFGGKVLTVILFRNVNFACGVATLGASTGNTVTVTPGFRMAGLITMADSGLFDGTYQGFDVFRAGFASYDGSTIRQSCFSRQNNDGFGTSDPTSSCRDGAVHNGNNGTAYATVQNVTSTNFEFLTEGSLGYPIGWAAIGGVYAWAGTLDTPTATGDEDYTGMGFQPRAGLLMPTMELSATGSVSSDARAGAVAFGAFNGTSEACTAWADQDGVTTTNTQSDIRAQALNFDADSGADAMDATFSEWLSTGVRLNYSLTNPSVRKMPALFLS